MPTCGRGLMARSAGDRRSPSTGALPAGLPREATEGRLLNAPMRAALATRKRVLTQGCRGIWTEPLRWRKCPWEPGSSRKWE
jgi:hypothetical protein